MTFQSTIIAISFFFHVTFVENVSFTSNDYGAILMNKNYLCSTLESCNRFGNTLEKQSLLKWLTSMHHHKRTFYLLKTLTFHNSVSKSTKIDVNYYLGAFSSSPVFILILFWLKFYKVICIIFWDIKKLVDVQNFGIYVERFWR